MEDWAGVIKPLALQIPSPHFGIDVQQEVNNTDGRISPSKNASTLEIGGWGY
jgi:hypothetical protein